MCSSQVICEMFEFKLISAHEEKLVLLSTATLVLVSLPSLLHLTTTTAGRPAGTCVLVSVISQRPELSAVLLSLTLNAPNDADSRDGHSSRQRGG